MTFKFMASGLTKSTKIVLGVAAFLFVASTLLTVFFGAIVGYFGLADTIPVWSVMTPYMAFFALLVLAVIVNIGLIVLDMIIHKNYNEYIELLKIEPKCNNKNFEDEKFEHYIFEGNNSY